MEFKLIIILCVLIGLMGLSGYAYWDYSQKQLQEQAARIEVQKLVIAGKDKEIDKMKADKELADAVRKGVDAAKTAGRKSVEQVRKQFEGQTKSGEEKDVGKAAVVKPKIIENAANKGTAEQARCFELLSGAPLTEDEKNGKITNKMCPELFGSGKHK